LEFCYNTVANQNDIEPEKMLFGGLMRLFNEKFPGFGVTNYRRFKIMTAPLQIPAMRA